MIVTVELEGRHYEVELIWDKIGIPSGAHGWWLRSIDGVPRPHGNDVNRIYRAALELAEKAMRSDRSQR